jgi:hypothetical protein
MVINTSGAIVVFPNEYSGIGSSPVKKISCGAE